MAIDDNEPKKEFLKRLQLWFRAETLLGASSCVREGVAVRGLGASGPARESQERQLGRFLLGRTTSAPNGQYLKVLYVFPCFRCI